MRFDILTIFPQFFEILNLSLVGKAKERGLFEIGVHDLRNWTHDVHNSVDDTPFGGGAGMVMKADVWAEAIDAVSAEVENNPSAKMSLIQNSENRFAAAEVTAEKLQPQIVLAIPTPAGKQLKQTDLYKIAKAQQVVVACGRYEGIDARICEYYSQQPRFEVFEFSLGDYVLNGGEVAAMALIEGVSRLLPGMVGNPQSLVEESHGSAGLLEYPNYTRPANFRGLCVPKILTSGNHGAIARWRKDRSLELTARKRPDLIDNLPAQDLDRKDRAKLAEMGWFVPQNAVSPVRIKYRQAALQDAQALSGFAFKTWPDACPDDMGKDNIEEYMRQHLTPQVFADYLTQPEKYLVYLAQVDLAAQNDLFAGEIVAYLLFDISCDRDGVVAFDEGAPVDFVYDGIYRDGPLLYLSKAYVERQWRGTGIFANFMDWALQCVAERFAEFRQPFIWLGTALQNKRAQRAYRALGFKKAGVREFVVGDEINIDVTMARPLNMA